MPQETRSGHRSRIRRYLAKRYRVSEKCIRQLGLDIRMMPWTARRVLINSLNWETPRACVPNTERKVARTDVDAFLKKYPTAHMDAAFVLRSMQNSRRAAS